MLDNDDLSGQPTLNTLIEALVEYRDRLASKHEIPEWDMGQADSQLPPELDPVILATHQENYPLMGSFAGIHVVKADDEDEQSNSLPDGTLLLRIDGPPYNINPSGSREAWSEDAPEDGWIDVNIH